MEKYTYAKTLKRIRQVEHLLYEGMTTATCRQTLARLWNWPELSERNARRYVYIAKKNMKKRFEKDAEADYQWCRENYMRLLREAIHRDDRQEQRRIVNDLQKLSGLDEQKITHKLEIDSNDITEIDKLFE